MPNDADASTPMLDQATRDYRVTLVSQSVRVLCKVVSVFTLARLVAPDQHGLYAMAGTVIGALMLFRDFGLGPAMVQAPNISEEQCTTLCRLHFLIGLALCGLTVALMPVAVWFFNEPRLTGLLLFLGCTFVFVGAGGFPRALLLRQMRFEEINRIETTAAVTGTGAMIVAGWLGAGAYSFGVFMLVVEAFTAVAAWRICRWRPQTRVRWAGLRAFFRPGTELTGYNILNYVVAQLDTLLVGKWFGAAALGPYSRASQLLALPTLHIVNPLAQVTFATLARLDVGSPGFVPHVRQCTNQIAHLTLPIAVLCAALPHEIVRLVLGPNWDVAAPILRWLALNAALTYLAAAVYPLCAATRHNGRLAAMTLVSAPFIAISLWLGSQHGPAGMAASLAAANAILFFPRLAWASLGTPVLLADFVAAVAGPVVLGLSAAVGVNIALLSVPAAGWQTRLVTGGSGGVLAMGLLVWLWPQPRNELRKVWALLPNFRKPGTS